MALGAYIVILEITMCNVMKIKMHCISNNGKKKKKGKEIQTFGFLGNPLG